MATITRNKLSGSTDGKWISSFGTVVTVHTAVSGITDWDEIWIYATIKRGATLPMLEIQWGETTDPDDYIYVQVKEGSNETCIIPGLLLNNEAIVKIKAFGASGSNSIYIDGFVNSIRN